MKQKKPLEAGAEMPQKKIRKPKSARMAPPTNGEILVKGVVMGIVISGISHASRSIAKAFVRRPLGLFVAGIASGYFAHKYRKELLTVSGRTAVESRNFILRQKENLGDLIAEIRDPDRDGDR
ncbi:hypothetical protein ACQE3E_18710 [Methylomonas sp. MED-D]|uniref:Uncharacterized protein n=1 Tax=Methylomonas koyamae TaxID=702114 RepID=A0A177NB06_9GAMM|nr:MULTISPECIES: hypothetical protein [Methylomonas]MDT4332523.1 hypothetical protein [Methylomonas sp. MV1]NJA07706.1 hypothetical protein [Methylococcaceae bacterium WWC4]OAI15246.1 hypothetical protein A1355_10935 [Methylomonas koyamae]WGS85317.1 hypothetical protein QC632_20070 [Methylomonas sp. UP202]